MKILFVQRVKAYAGSERYFTSIIPELIRRGIHCKLLFVIHPKDYHKLDLMMDTIERQNISCEIIFSKRNTSWTLLRKLNKVAKKDNYDLIHLHLIHAEFWFSLIKKFMNKSLKLVSTIHGFDESFQAEYGFDPKKVTNTRYVRILKFNQKYIHRYYAVSKALKRLMVESNIIPREKIEVIYYGFDYPEIASKKRNEHPVILVPGRVVPYKGQDLMLKAMLAVLKKFPKAKCLFAGDLQGDFGESLKISAKKSGVDANVEFLGHVADMDELYARTDVIVLTSKSEGFGLVMLEAFNAEKPVVSFDVPAFNEIIEDGKTGLFCVPFNTEQMAENIIRLIDDKELYESIRKNAKEKLLVYFNLERMAKETIRFYEDAVSDSA